MQPRWLWTLLIFFAVTPQLSSCGGAAHSGPLGIIMDPVVAFLFGILLVTVGAATGVAAILVNLDVKISIYIFLVSSIMLAGSLRSLDSVRWHNSNLLETVTILTILISASTWLGSLFAAGFLYPGKIVLALLIVGGASGICFLVYTAWSTRAVILSYELWLLLLRLVGPASN
jgi:hypothetical protein